MAVIIFIIILAVLVFVHELGHFIAAKAFGIRVDEFALGFPPKIFSYKYGETVYALNSVPFGGYVKIFGENPDEDSINGPDKARSLVHKPKSVQAIVLVAGISFNVIFAWLIISLGFMIGMPVPQDYVTDTHIDNVKVTILSVLPNSPAEKAGLKTGDSVIGLGEGAEAITRFSVADVQTFISAHKDQPIQLNFERGKEASTTIIVPEVGPVAERATVGVTLGMLGTLRLSFFQSLWEGGKLTVTVVTETAKGIVMFISQAVTGKATFSQVSGPVGIAGLVGDANRLGLVYLLSFTAFISINLAVINLIPFPALDGGRLLFILIEKIKGSAINPKIANTINSIGFILLICLMLLITYHDIVMLIGK